MSSAAASPPSRTVTPFAAAQAARRRLEADPGFHSLVDDKDGGQAGAGATSSAGRPASTLAAKSKVIDVTSTDAAAKAPAPSSGTAANAATGATPQPLLPPAPAPTQATATAAGGGTKTSAAADDAAQAAAAPRPAGLEAGRLGASLIAQRTSDDLAEADEEAGGTGELLPGGAQGGSQGAAPAGASSGPAPPALAAGSAAQPLMAALSGSGATLVKAQVGPTATALRSAVATSTRAKGASAAMDLAGKLTTPLMADPPDAAAQAPVLLALADAPSQDDPSGDSASDDGSATPDDTAAAAQTGFIPSAGSQAQSLSQVAGSAPPMSASAADLAAQMAAKVSAGSSRFQLQLNPLGLGRVDVSVSIGRDRQLTAALSFADPQTASALSAHAGELKTALEQAGFNVPAGGFDFTSNTGAMGANLGGSNPEGGFSDGSGQSSSGRMAAFGAGEALAAAGANDSTAWTAGGDSRLDIRI